MSVDHFQAGHGVRPRRGPIPNFRPGTPTSAYYAHLENIRSHLTIEDYSRVDAVIALRLRSNGYAGRAWKKTFMPAPTTRESQDGRNWQRYAERTADYAFGGPAGDRDMERIERYRELWRRVEGGEEKVREARGRMR